MRSSVEELNPAPALRPVVVVMVIFGLVLAGCMVWLFLFVQQRFSDPVVGQNAITIADDQDVGVADKLLQDQVVDLEQRVASLEAQFVDAQTTISPPSEMNSAPASNTQPVASAAIREQTITLGSGSTVNRTWTDIPETTSVINTANYGYIQSVRFEATLSIIGGEVYARVINKKTGAIVAASEVVHNSSTPMLVASTPFDLFSGSNEYVVQLRSSSGELAQLHEARLKIEVQY